MELAFEPSSWIRGLSQSHQHRYAGSRVPVHAGRLSDVPRGRRKRRRFPWVGPDRAIAACRGAVGLTRGNRGKRICVKGWMLDALIESHTCTNAAGADRQQSARTRLESNKWQFLIEYGRG